MKILAGGLGGKDLEDKNKDVSMDSDSKDPDNKDPSKNDVIIDMRATVTSEIEKSSKFIHEETTNEKNQESGFIMFLKGLYILLFVTAIACTVDNYFGYRS